MTDIYNTAAASSSCPPEMLQVLIITLLKPGKDPTSPQNFRLIYLLNIDLNIYAKLIALRLLSIMPLFIQPDQSRFTKGRQTSDGSRRLITIIHLANSQKEPSLLLYLDAEKAFDRIHWDYLGRVLSAFGFSGSIFSAIMALYSKPSAQVYSPGLLSTPLPITNGTRRQSYPLLPLIFDLLMELLASFFCSHPQITGFHTPTTTHTINLFVDDIILMITDVENSLASVHEALMMFNNISCYKPNHIFFLSETKTSSLVPLCVETRWDQIPTLIFNAKNLFAANYLPFLDTIRSRLRELSKCELSWSGHLAAFKMILLPQLLYLFRTMPILVPESFFKSAQSLLNKLPMAGEKS